MVSGFALMIKPLADESRDVDHEDDGVCGTCLKLCEHMVKSLKTHDQEDFHNAFLKLCEHLGDEEGDEDGDE
jgi:hypothetical protein